MRWADSGKPDFPDERDYRDPVGGEFAGDWLASTERVRVRLEGAGLVDTGWVVVIQERRTSALLPVTALKWRLGYGAAVAIAFILVMVLVMWAGMMSVVDSSSRSRVTRLLRRWAGLPLPTTGPRSAGTGWSSGSVSIGTATGGSPVMDQPLPPQS